MEKSKAQPQIRASSADFYKYTFFCHFKFGVAPLLADGAAALITTASLGTRRERAAFETAVGDVMKQTIRATWKPDFMPAHSDPCLQVADYCAWAIQRKWERDDARSYALIEDRITYEFDLWQERQTHHY